MRRTAVFRDSLFLEHDPGPQHVERADRLAVVHAELDKPEVGKHFLSPGFHEASRQSLLRVHSERHVARIEATAGRSFGILDPDTYTSARSCEAAKRAAGSLLTGVDLLFAGEIDNGFALVRPPGHHAEQDAAMGFCLFNNVAVAAQYALDSGKASRVLVVDWDLHHGNGTQKSFYGTDQVLYFSTHQYPYYPGTGAFLETGDGPGEGFTVNLPLPGGQDDAAYGRIFRELLAPVARRYRPDLILLSAGFDIYQGDPLGGMQVSIQGFRYLTRLLARLAEELCGGRLLATLEGGYNLVAMRDGVLAVLAELSGADHLATPLSATDEKRLESSRHPVPGLEQALDIAKTFGSL